MHFCGQTVEMEFSSVKFDCRYFRGGIPCVPNKKFGVDCKSCAHYDSVKKRVLIIKLGALGDVIRTTPLVTAFSNKYQGVHITWITQSPAILPQQGIDEIWKWDEITMFRAQNREFDIAINLDKEEEACQLLAKVRADEKYGYSWKDNHIAAATPAAEHKLITGFFDHLSKANTKSYLEEIFDICHLAFNGEEYLINLSEELSEKWKVNFEKIASGKKVVGLNTGCGPRWNTRLWSEGNWIALAENLKDRGFFPVFLGGELEHEKNKRMAAQSGVYYPGHFSLEEFIALTSGVDIVVTQVSMMMHIATALRRKLVLCNTIFNAFEFDLYGRGIIIGPENGCDCFYGNSCIHGTPCMEKITPDQIVDGLLKLEG